MNPPDDISQLAAEFDLSDMAGVIAGLPDQIEFAYGDPGFPDVPSGPFSDVVVAGMGGSALPADVLTGAFAGKLRALRVCRDYRCVEPSTEPALVLSCSFSGNTEETIAATIDLADRGHDVVVLTAGGRLEELAKERRFPLVRLPAHRHDASFQPRSATGYFATYLARVLSVAGWFQHLAEFETLPAFLRELEVRPAAEDLARWFGDRIPIVYTDSRHVASVGRVFKIKLNEHAKRPAFYNELPEVNHKEMIGFTLPGAEFAVVYIRDPSGDPRVHRRFHAMQSVFRANGFDHVDFREWSLPGDTDAERTFAGMMFGDWCAYTAALLGGVDPTPVALVEEFKRTLATE